MTSSPGSSASSLRKGNDISERLLGLSVAVIALVRSLARDMVSRHIGAQLLRCGTSAGANYEEARSAESRADFVHKIRIASKELKETVYWIRLAERACGAVGGDSNRRITQEASELIAILYKSAQTARASQRL